MKVLFSYAVIDRERQLSTTLLSFGGGLPAGKKGSVIHTLEFKSKTGTPFKCMYVCAPVEEGNTTLFPEALSLHCPMGLDY